MMILRVILLAVLMKFISSRSALKAFVERRHLQNCTATIFAGENKSWIEYKYVFDDINDFDAKYEILKVGFFNTNPALTRIDSHIIQILSESLQFSVEVIDINITEPINLSHFRNIDLLISHTNAKYNRDIRELNNAIKNNFVVVYKLKNIQMTNDIFILTFVGTLWLCFLVLFLAMAVCLRRSTYHYSKIYREEKQWSWVEITLWAIAAACQQGLSYAPNRFASRCLFFLGYLTAYLLYTGFAAAITSILVRQEDIYLNISPLDKHIEVYAYGTKQFKDVEITNEVTEIDELFNHLEKKNAIALAPEIFITTYLNKRDHENYIVMPVSGNQFHKGFLVPVKSQWKEVLNKQLVKLEEIGILNYITSKNRRFSKLSGRVGYSSASLKHVGSALYVYLAGLIAALIFLVFECAFVIYQRYKRMYREKTIRSRMSSIVSLN